MGGEIGVNSVWGEGSEFWFTLWLAVLPSQAESPSVSKIKSLRALVIDSNTRHADAVVESLSQWSIQSCAAHSTEEALHLVSTEAPFQFILIQSSGAPSELRAFIRKLHDKMKDMPKPFLIRMLPLGQLKDVHHDHRDIFDASVTAPLRSQDMLETLIQSGNPDRNNSIGSVSKVESARLEVKANHQTKILLVEDNTTNQMVAKQLLKRAGFSPDLAANGAEAIHMLSEKAYDVVLMDIQMPVMDGIEATRRIRDGRDEVRNPEIPIIAITAHSMKGDREYFLSVGMNDYISKPIDAEHLAKTLSKWIPASIPNL